MLKLVLSRFVAHRSSPSSKSRLATGTRPVVELDRELGVLHRRLPAGDGSSSSSRAMAKPRRSVACGPRPTTIRVIASISFRAASTSDAGPLGDGVEVAFQVVGGLRDQPRRIPAHLGLEVVQVTSRRLEPRPGPARRRCGPGVRSPPSRSRVGACARWAIDSDRAAPGRDRHRRASSRPRRSTGLIPGFEGLARLPELVRAPPSGSTVMNFSLVVLGPLDAPTGRPPRSVGLGRRGVVRSRVRMRPTWAVDPLEGRDRRQGVVLDRGRDVQGDLRRRVEPAVGDLVEDRAVPLVADAGEDGDRATGRAAGPVPGR